MNKYTWNVAPRGENPLKIITLADTRNEAKETAIAIGRDIWQEAYAENPGLQTTGKLLSVEQVIIPITADQEFL